MSARSARPRWLRRFFSSGSSSARVSPLSGRRKTGSYPNPPEPLGACNPSFEDPFCAYPLAVRPGDHHRRPEAGTPPLIRDPLKGLEEKAVVFLVGGLRPSEPRGLDPGPAAERVHFEPGVVRKGGKACGLGHRPRLLEGILQEGHPVLYDLSRSFHIGEGEDLYPGSGEESGDLPHLTLILRCKNKPSQASSVGHRLPSSKRSRPPGPSSLTAHTGQTE